MEVIFLTGTVIMMMLPIEGWSREGVDSVQVNYDSIQDARIDRMEWRNGRRFRIMGEEQEKQQGKVDSIKGAVSDLEIRLQELEEESLFQKEQLEILEKELDETRRISGEYRRRLQHFLWVSGIVILLLLGLTVLILLMFGMKTRQLLERFKRNQQQVSEELSGEISNREAVLMAAISAHDQRVKNDLKLQRRELRQKMKAETKAAEKDTRKRIKKAIRKLRSGRRKLT